MRLFLFAVLVSSLCFAQQPTVNPGSPAGTTVAAAEPPLRVIWEKVSTPAAATQINFFTINSANHWFIADRLQGYFRSTDQGTTWTQINSSGISLCGWTIQVNPANGDLVAGSCGRGSSFYRSRDEGASWKQIPNPPGFFLSLAGAQSGCAFAPSTRIICGGYFGQGIVWVSADNGTHTKTAETKPVIGSAYSLGYNVVTHDVWLGTEQKGFFRSVDNGDHFVQVSPNSTSLDPSGIRNGNAYGVAFDHSGTVFFSTGGGVFKSDSTAPGGYTWKWVLANRNTSAGKGIGVDASGNIYWGHNRDPLNPILIYRSTDGGDTWSEYDSGIPPLLEGHEFLPSPFDGKVYAVIEDGKTNSGWLYRTTH